MIADSFERFSVTKLVDKVLRKNNDSPLLAKKPTES